MFASPLTAEPDWRDMDIDINCTINKNELSRTLPTTRSMCQIGDTNLSYSL